MNENLNPQASEEKADKTIEQKEQTVEDAVNVEPTTEADKEKAQELSKDELIGKLKSIAMLAVEDIPQRAEVEVIKQAYYRLRSTEIEAQKEEFLKDAENTEGDFEANHDPSEDVLKIYLEEIKEKRAKQLAEEKKLREDNYKKKLVIIDEIKELTESTEDFNKLYNKFKELQDKWKEIKLVPHSKERELWTAYQIQSEMFYDLIKINNEFRDYDFKKNLEQKTKYCEAVEKLAEEVDAISAFHQLQNYHKLWREVGPVVREIREEIWTRFSAASTTVNKKYQEHFEELKGQEEENLLAKTNICELLETIDYSKLNSFKKWNDKTKEVLGLQAKWRTIGFVPRKVNNKIYEEFRGLCDVFFQQKSEFFKKMRNEMDGNLVKKQALVEEANSLKDSTDWRATTPRIIEIQRRWKEIGPVSRKHSDTIWNEFVGACDSFFERKKSEDKSERELEKKNLEDKTAVVGKIQALDEKMDSQELLTQIRSLTDEWYKIGFVPFKQKDKSYEDFHKALDSHYDLLKIDKSERRMENFKSNVEQMTQHNNPNRTLRKERDQLMFRYNKLRSDLQTYENNMSFLSISSKSASGLLKDVNTKIEKLQSEMNLLSQKINAIDDAFEEVNE